MTRFSEISTLLVAILLAGGCAATPALHVIGVYEGQAPPGSDDKPWWAKCGDAAEGKEPGGNSEAAAVECHRKYAGVQLERKVVVNVSDATRPIVLALMAYDNTVWKLVLADGVKLTRIILAGYHAQRVEGPPAGTPIETYTYDPSPCERCWQGGEYFYSHERPPAELLRLTGMKVTTFQGRYQGSEFSIFPGMKRDPGRND